MTHEFDRTRVDVSAFQRYRATTLLRASKV